MSLQRIFESARKLGVPVIVTDPAGRDPMVVIPLEQFEALAGEGSPRSEAPMPKAPSVQEPVEVPIIAQEKADFAQKAIADESLPNDISMDERFYLEPVDEEAA